MALRRPDISDGATQGVTYTIERPLRPNEEFNIAHRLVYPRFKRASRSRGSSRLSMELWVPAAKDVLKVVVEDFGSRL